MPENTTPPGTTSPPAQTPESFTYDASGLSFADQQGILDKQAATAKGAEREAAVPAHERRIKAANANKALWDPKDPGHDAAKKELREAIAASASPEEQLRLANEPVETLRSRFTINDPKDDKRIPEP